MGCGNLGSLGSTPHHYMSDFAKKTVLTLLPRNFLQVLKRFHYLRTVRAISETDEPDLRVLKYLLEPGNYVADIGANIGVYAKYLSQCVGSQGRVISVEPIPPTFDILRSNVEKLRLTNVEVKNYAISDSERQVKMQVPKYGSGGENFYEARIEDSKAEGVERSFVVPATTVDTLLSAEPALHFIKCDVEGHELNCIKGAQKTIARFRPAWLIEISGAFRDETFRLLKSSGYDAFWFDGGKLRPQGPATTSVNYFFLAPPHLERLREKGLPFAN